jgi:hypothetical protein
MATSNPRLSDDYAPKGRKMGFLRLSGRPRLCDHGLCGDHRRRRRPLRCYGRAAGASMVYVPQGRDHLHPIVYTHADGGTTWAAVDSRTAMATLADPGHSAPIPVTRSASIAITTAGAETNTLAIPTFIGQQLALICDVYVGDRVITSAQAINQAANTIMTFGAAADMIVLQAMQVGGALRWRVVANDGVALS